MSIAFGLLILRVVVGMTLAGHGAQKVFGWWGGPGMTGWIGVMKRMRIRPAVMWGWASALAELLGGLAVAIGILSPLGSFAITGAMLVAIALVHWPKGFWVSKGGFEFNLLIIATVAALAVIGPGAYSADHVLGINLPEPLVLIVGTLATVAGVAVALTTRAPQVAPESKPQTA
jgi:putative oxidoreductase